MNFTEGVTNATKGVRRRLDDMSQALPEQRGSKIQFENYLVMARQRAATDEQFREQFEASLAEYAARKAGRR